MQDGLTDMAGIASPIREVARLEGQALMPCIDDYGPIICSNVVKVVIETKTSRSDVSSSFCYKG